MLKKIVTAFTLLTTLVVNTNGVLTPVINYCPYGEDTVVDYYKNNKRVGGKSRVECTKYPSKDIEYDFPIVFNASEFLGNHGDDPNILPNNDLLWNNLPPLGGSKCIDDDEIYSIKMGVIMDYGTYKMFHKDNDLIIKMVEQYWKQVNYLYVNQFGVMFTIEHLIIDQDENNRWDNKDCKLSIRDHFQQVARTSKPSLQALWHIFSTCDMTDSAIGLGHVGTNCNYISLGYTTISRSSFTTIAHEIGHNMGANHHNNGGIMSAEKTYNNILQFHPASKPNICKVIKGLEECDDPLKMESSTDGSTCGNGIVEAGEECECASGTSCKCCKDCKLKGECDPLNGPCCNEDCTYKDTSDECVVIGTKGYCRSGYCQIPFLCGGRIDDEASTKGKFCGIHEDNVCKIKCEFQGICSKMVDWTVNGRDINWAFNGALCRTSTISNGACKDGKCIEVGPQHPTPKPVPTPKPTPKPTPRPSLRPPTSSEPVVGVFDKKKSPSKLCGGIWEDVFDGIDLKLNCVVPYSYSDKYKKKMGKIMRPLSDSVAKITGMGNSTMEIEFQFVNKKGNSVNINDVKFYLFGIEEDEWVEVKKGNVVYSGSSLTKKGNVYSGTEKKEKKVKKINKQSSKTRAQTLEINSSGGSLNLKLKFDGKSKKIDYHYFSVERNTN